MISSDTLCAVPVMFKEGEFIVQQKDYKDAWGLENLRGETGEAFLVWLSQKKTENGTIFLSH